MDRLATLKQFLIDEPHDPFVKYAIATEYLSREDFTAAENAFSLLLEEHPEYIPTYYHFGKLLFELGKASKSTEILKEGMKRATESRDRKTASEIEELISAIKD